MSQKNIKKISAEKFVGVANTCENTLSEAFVSVMKAIAEVSKFAETIERDRTKSWPIYVKYATGVQDKNEAIKKLKKSLNAASSNIKALVEKLDEL